MNYFFESGVNQMGLYRSIKDLKNCNSLRIILGWLIKRSKSGNKNYQANIHKLSIKSNLKAAGSA